MCVVYYGCIVNSPYSVYLAFMFHNINYHANMHEHIYIMYICMLICI